MAMTPSELAERVFHLIEGLSTDDLADVVREIGDPEDNSEFPDALRYQAWYVVDQAQRDPSQLLAVANPILAKAIGWDGAPLLTREDVQV